MVEVVQKQAHMLCGGVFGVGGLWEHIREPAAVELHEGVKGPLVPQSVKQVIFILINIRDSLQLLAWTFCFMPYVRFSTGLSFYKFQTPKDRPPNCWSPIYQAQTTLNIPKHLCQREKQMV